MQFRDKTLRIYTRMNIHIRKYKTVVTPFREGYTGEKGNFFLQSEIKYKVTTNNEQELMAITSNSLDWGQNDGSGEDRRTGFRGTHFQGEIFIDDDGGGGEKAQLLFTQKIIHSLQLSQFKRGKMYTCFQEVSHSFPFQLRHLLFRFLRLSPFFSSYNQIIAIQVNLQTIDKHLWNTIVFLCVA